MVLILGAAQKHWSIWTQYMVLSSRGRLGGIALMLNQNTEVKCFSAVLFLFIDFDAGLPCFANKIHFFKLKELNLINFASSCFSPEILCSSDSTSGLVQE